MKQFGSLPLTILIKDPDWPLTLQVNQVYSLGHWRAWVSYLANSVWRHSIFLIKGPIFITGHEWLKERLCCKTFEQTQVSTPTKHAFLVLRWETFLPGSDDKLTEQPLTCFVPTKYTRLWRKPNNQFKTCYLGWSQAMVRLRHHSSSHMTSDSLRKSTSCIWKRCCCSELSGWLLEDRSSGTMTLHNATEVNGRSFDYENITVTTLILTSGRLNPQIAIFLIILCGA